MPISFNEIPNNTKVPLFYAEFDNSRASTALGAGLEALLIGQKLTAGTIGNAVPVEVNSVEQAKTFFGKGSMLARMAEKYFINNNGKNSVTCIAAAEPSGSALSVAVAFTGTTSAAGVVNLYAGGRRYQTAIPAGTNAAGSASAVTLTIGADTESVFTAAVSGHTLTLTHKQVGTANNSTAVELNYYDNDVFPTGVTATATRTAGTGDVNLNSVINALPDKAFRLIACPFTNTSALTAMQTELADRFGIRQLDGYAIHAKKDTLADLTTFGDTLNSQFTTIVGYDGGLEDEAEWAAAVVGATMAPAQEDPARPFQTLQLKGLVAPQPVDLFSRVNRESLLTSGIATFFTSPNGDALIERLVTTFKRNQFGSPDNSYMDLNTLLTLALIRNEVKTMTESKYPRHKIGNDGQIYGLGQAIITPKTYKTELVALASSWVERAYIEDLDTFKTNLIVQRNTVDPNRLDVLMPPDLVNQLRIVGVKIQFLLQGV